MTMTVDEKPVSVSLENLRTGIDNETLTKAFGPNSLGIVIVRDLPPEFQSLRQKVLTSASILANLDQEELAKLECEEAMWLVGWSRGREKLAKSSLPDFKKGSFYMNCAFHKDPKLEGPESKLTEKYPDYKPYTASNIWPRNNGLEDFQHDCKALCSLIIEVAGTVAKACDKYIKSIYDDYDQSYLQLIVEKSTCTKARLLHYFPKIEEDTNESVDDWCSEHLDHSCLTGLTSALFIDESKGLTHALDTSPDLQAGLYIKNRNNEIVKVSIPADCLAFQSGSALQEISKGRFKAVLHYVRGTEMPNIARNTLAVFCQPDLDDMINEKEDFARYSDRILRALHHIVNHHNHISLEPMQYNEIPVINDKSIPEEDELVRKQLKELGQPVFINGEDDHDRRERLANLVNGGALQLDDAQSEDEEKEDEEVFYTPGPAELYGVRCQILNQSLVKASQRIQQQRQVLQNNPDFTTFLKKRRTINSKLADIELYGSQVIHGNTRAISSVRYSPSGDLIACGTWNGSVHVLNSNDLNPTVKLLNGQHTEKVGSVDWQVNDTILITGGSEGSINVWNITDSDDIIKPELSIKEAHLNRITNTLFHPINNFAISTSFDQTWKLWDINKEAELYQQEGHSKEVYSGAIHPDGSLFLSGGLDGIIHVWDLRSGRALMPLQKHIQGVYSLDWSPNGYLFASGSGDCSVKIWDMRKLEHSGDEVFSIPAHTKLVSDVRFHCGKVGVNENENGAIGSFLVSSSYDGSVKVWSADNWILVKTLKGHNEKVMSCDVTSDENSRVRVVSSGWDRTVKLWQ